MNKLSGQEFAVQKKSRGGKVDASFPGNGAFKPHNEVKFIYPCILKAKTCNLSFYLFQDKLLLIVDVIVDLADIFRDLATYRPEWLGILMSVRVLVSSISVINKLLLLST